MAADAPAHPAGKSKKKLTSKTEGLTDPEKRVLIATHKAIERVSEVLNKDYAFNVAIAELMKLSNTLAEGGCPDSPVYDECVRALFQMLAPMAPHLCSEVWHGLASFPHPRLPPAK